MSTGMALPPPAVGVAESFLRFSHSRLGHSSGALILYACFLMFLSASELSESIEPIEAVQNQFSHVAEDGWEKSDILDEQAGMADHLAHTQESCRSKTDADGGACSDSDSDLADLAESASLIEEIPGSADQVDDEKVQVETEEAKTDDGEDKVDAYDEIENFQVDDDMGSFEDEQLWPDDASEEVLSWSSCTPEFCSSNGMVLAYHDGQPRLYPSSMEPNVDMCCYWL